MPGDPPRARLRVLVVATKPPWPPLGGGSLTLHALLTGLCEHGAAVRVVSLGPSPAPDRDLPYEVQTTGSQPRSWASPFNVGRFPWPLVMARYQVARLRTAVGEALERFRPDLVHLEQLHTAWLLPWLRRHRPVVLREQNAEHRLVSRVADMAPLPLRAVLRFEAWLLARGEARSCQLADAVAAISDADAAALAELAPAARIVLLPAAYPEVRAAAKGSLAGAPPYLALGSFDWRANRDGALWLIREVWPRLRSLTPGAVLHMAGAGSRRLPGAAGDGIVFHGPVPDASVLFYPRAIALVPVRGGSGVRLRRSVAPADSRGRPAAELRPRPRSRRRRGT